MKDLRRWKALPGLWIGRIQIVKMAVLLKAILRFNAIPVKTAIQLCIDLERTIFSFIYKYKTPSIDKTFLDNKRTAG